MERKLIKCKHICWKVKRNFKS